MRAFVFILSLVIGSGLSVPGARAQASDETLADIRQELSVLFVEIQKLKRELSTTGGAGTVATGGSALQRLDAIEAEVQRLTSKTETLEHTINSVVSDGTNRIGDLEFRLVELEGGDVSKLGDTPTLGGVTPGPVAAAPADPVKPPETELAISEESDFKRAQDALAAGDNRSAADLFAAFGESYPGSPLEAQAQIGRGKALEALGEISQAARSYLAAFSGAPNGPHAAEALYNVGRMLGALDQVQEACVTLREVPARFPSSPFAGQAQTEMQARACQ
ncbi:tol-pal system protein [Oceanicola sp. 22II-s10i]|uniref:tetratricopeptide repeat protein n=1 Tax=Oceanicola sp. 22II-s10i TaxID=1317116 RepID=UPI000B52160F|nr:tetratricopeptide repeat protein [Oceanicola sp. 22II-s10i]OWU85473.1 tol-pal system protein [Oceanicola sp. 22II-s10i]